MATVNMHEAKSTLSKLVEKIESGHADEIIIARNGKPAARLVPIQPKRKGSRLGAAKGLYPPMSFEGFQALDADVAAAFYGDATNRRTP